MGSGGSWMCTSESEPERRGGREEWGRRRVLAKVSQVGGGGVGGGRRSMLPKIEAGGRGGGGGEEMVPEVGH